MILDAIAWYSMKLKEVPKKYPKVTKSIYKSPKAPESTKEYRKVLKSTEMYWKVRSVPKSTQEYQKKNIPKRTQK